MRMQRTGWMWLGALCVALAVLGVSGGLPSGSLQAQNARGTLVYGLGGEPKLLDTGDSSDNNASIVQAQIYNSLVGYKPGTLDLVPDLAVSWVPSENYTVWTFQLRRGLRFQDGTPFNADAVKFNVERWWDLQSPYSFANAGRTHVTWRVNMGGFKGQPSSVLKDVVVTGPYTIRFITQSPFPNLPGVLAGDGHFGIASPTAVQADGPKYGSPSALPVGTGPFIAKSWTPGDRIVLVKNPGYWKRGLPKSDGLVIKFISDPAAQLADVQAGTVDFTADLLPEQLKIIQADPQLRPVFAPTTNVGFLNLNPAYAPLSKPEVRRAVATAIDQQGIVDAFFGRQLAVTNGHFTPPVMSWAWSPKVTSYPYDPAKAKQMLAEAGYPNGFDLDLWYMPVPRPYFPTPRQVAEAIGANLSAIGLR
ncbi:MAG TPA: ABC transporter substrate-binding protein, partial [bacterium]|nr:ABC transporter substrate-binding protein [bacterium]